MVIINTNLLKSLIFIIFPMIINILSRILVDLMISLTNFHFLILIPTQLIFVIILNNKLNFDFII